MRQSASPIFSAETLVSTACSDNTLGDDALARLRKNPDYFGSGELQRARSFISGG